jgi:hypothetical protein
MEVSDQLHAQAALSPENDPPMGGPPSLCGYYGEKKNLASAVNRTSAVQPILRSFNDRVTSTC